VIVVSGFSPTNKVPGAKGANVWAAGPASSALFPRFVLLVGLMGSGSIATANVVNDIRTQADAAKFGVRSELARECRAALKIPGAVIKAVAVAPPSSPTAGTATITIGGTWSVNWTPTYRIAGETVSAVAASTDTPTQVAVKIAAAINANPFGPVTATPSGAVVTITADAGSVRNAHILLAQDQQDMPSTATSALSGGTATTGGMVPLTGGAGVESYTALHAAIATAQYDRIAIPSNDATSLGAWRTHLVSEAASTIGHLEAGVYATNGTLTAAQALVAALNEPLLEILWAFNSETPPAELAAIHAADRSVVESSNPSPRYMNRELVGAKPQAYREDWPIESVRDAALNSGVSPCMTTEDGRLVVNRAVTNYFKLGTAQDDRVLDVAQVSMSLFARERLAYIWNTEIIPNYERVAPDPGENDPLPPAGTITPSLWNAQVFGEMRRWERNGWNVMVDEYPPVTEYDRGRKCLMGNYPVAPSQGNYQLGFNVLQVGNP
jgi:phage tail sheath gpL-like